MATKAKNQNPYREGSAYSAIFAAIQVASKGGATAKGITRSELLAQGHSPSDVTVVCSPRKEGESRGDCRGNLSARGEVYFMATKRPKGSTEKSYLLRWRPEVLEKRVRPLKKVIAPQKTSVEQVEKEVEEVVTA